jgi:acyl-CoA synthetase (AMP-forming)/AMP-acid ligase II
MCGLTGRTYHYSEVRERSQNFAGSLLGSGFKPGQVFTSVLPNTPEFPLIALGLLEAGMSFSPINFLYTPGKCYTN